MQNYKNVVENFIHNEILSKTGEIYFDFSKEEDCLYHELDFIGKNLCQDYVKGPSSFYIIDSVRVQAVAIHNHKIVLIFKGMLEQIFRTAAMMVGAERRHKESNEIFYEPWFDNVNLWINRGEFEWTSNEYWWLHDQEYRKAFDILVEALFIFLVLHEIGHLHNLHGERRNDSNEECVSPIDTITFIHKAIEDNEEMDETERLNSHAREIVADTFAFQFMMSELKESLFPNSEYEGADPTTLTAINFGVCIYAVASYLWALNFRCNSDCSTHPPHVFRLASIEAACLEHRVCGGDEKLTILGLEIGMRSYLKKMKCVCNSNEFVEWRNLKDTPANQEYYEKICGIIPNWSNSIFGVRDENWLQ